MSDDPFARFERSRFGLAIPLVIFVLGALGTSLAIGAMDPLVRRHQTLQQPNAVPDPAVENADPAVENADPAVENSDDAKPEIQDEGQPSDQPE